jgi:hypothetical protein
MVELFPSEIENSSAEDYYPTKCVTIDAPSRRPFIVIERTLRAPPVRG